MIVNPWFFYLMHIATMLSDLCLCMSLFGVGGAAIAAMMLAFEMGQDTYAARQNKLIIKVALPVAIVGAIGMVFIPTEETILMMQAARLATTDNVNAVFETLKEAIDYAVTVLK